MIRGILVVGGLVLALLLGSALILTRPWQPDQDQASAPIRPVASILVARQPLDAHSVPGVIVARTEVMLGFQTLGRITVRNVDIGDTVRKAEVIARLDPDDLRSDVNAAQAAVEAAQVDLLTAQSTAERTRALARRNVASTAQLEQVERMLAAAQASMQQARSELVRANDAAGFAEMKAPFDGVVSAVFANAGAVVSAGEPVLQLSAEDDLEAVIDLPSAALSNLQMGSRYEVWSESDDQNRQLALVSQIEPIADAATRTRRVHLALANDDSFRLGAMIRARPASKDQTGMSLPQTAILRRDDQPMVWVVIRDGTGARVDLRQVTLDGPAVGGFVGVTSGIAAGDEIVIRGINSLTQNQPVGRSVTP